MGAREEGRKAKNKEKETTMDCAVKRQGCVSGEREQDRHGQQSGEKGTGNGNIF